MAASDDAAVHHDDMYALLGTEIRRRRSAAGLSQQRLAARVGTDQGMISKAETGAKPPSFGLVQAIDDALHAEGELVRLRRQASSADPDNPDAVRARGQQEVVTMATRRSREFALSHQAALSAETLEQVYDDVRALAVAYPQTPLCDVLGRLVDTQDAVFTLLEQRQRPQQARQLYLLAGIGGGLLSKASHDLADPHAAMTHARTAFVCADNADHDGLRRVERLGPTELTPTDT